MSDHCHQLKNSPFDGFRADVLYPSYSCFFSLEDNFALMFHNQFLSEVVSFQLCYINRATFAETGVMATDATLIRSTLA